MFLLWQALLRLGGSQLVVCHFNYHKRPDSNYDEKIVKDYCVKNNIRFFSRTENQSIGDKTNFQAWARIARYDFFAEIAQNEKCAAILVGHTFNDFCETFIMQKQRRNFVKYYGINYVGEYSYKTNKTTIYRPLIAVKKNKIITKLHENKITYAIDSSNSKEIYLRNRIRNQMLSTELDDMYREAQQMNLELKQMNVNIAKAICFDYINYKTYSNLGPEEKARCIYHFLAQHIQKTLYNKKSKFITEIVKQFNSPRGHQTFIINRFYQLVKSPERIVLSHGNK